MDALERYNILQCIDAVTVFNLKTATAGQRLCRYVVPPTGLNAASPFARTNTLQHGFEILGHFFLFDGAGGAVTTPAVMSVNINGVESQVNNPAGAATNWSRLTVPANAVDGQALVATVEQTVWPNTGSSSYPQVGNLVMNNYPIGPTVKGGDLLETWLVTQGAGAGAQLGRPFLVVRGRLFGDNVNT